ncbi:MAG TPA: DUF5916 domain-containing protein [Chitinophagaceae bacterium]|jgi:hypothetical protein|nr:DUF5916 domain-containing protein [Chitinophagaceae bacterium]
MKTVSRILYAAILTLLCKKTIAQHSSPDSIEARFISSQVNFDGNPNESAWQNAFRINNFTQRELHFGEPASEKTETAILYDNDNLYIGVWCYQQKPEKIAAKFMQRDFDYENDDVFGVLISPFNDGRNGYLFIINPNGARADLQVSWENDNIDWNGVWDAKTTRNSEGWFAEIQIPFNTLQFRRENSKIWGINFARKISYKNEEDRWQGWSRDYSFENLSNAGTLTDIKDIGYAKHFEFKPYALGGFEKNRDPSGEKTNYPGKLGADLNINVTPTLKLNLTTNTDFAQVEVDRIQANLTRFNLYYPEKREFFLESTNSFQVYLGNNNQLFYSRQIGIQDLQPVNILGGARLFGKVGRNNIGFLCLETGKADSVPATNNTVFRYKYDIGSQSYIGTIITSKINSNSANQVVGIDANYTISNFLKNKNLVIAGLIAESFDDYTTKNNSLAYRVYCDYPNDLIDHYIALSSAQQNFNPELGFLTRGNYNAFNWHLNIMPRWFKKLGIQQMDFQLWELSYYVTQSTKDLESWTNETRPLGFILKSGERFEFNLQHSYDRLDHQFDLTDSAIIPVGKYHMHNTELQFSTYQARKIWAAVFYNWGTFYTGRIRTFETSAGINFSKHFNIKTEYTYSYVILPTATVNSNELAQYLNYAFTTKIDISLFAQWNSLEDFTLFNFRLHWIPKIGTDFYFVYNRGYEQVKKIDFLKPTVSSGIGKLVWRFTF